MNRRSIFILSAITTLGLAMLPGSALAQQKTLKDQLVGTWTLVSAETIEPNGTKIPLVKGTPVKGLQVFTADGKVSFQVIGDHARVASNDRTKMTPEEIKATAESILSYFGTYTVNETEKSYTLRIESSSFQNQTANPGKRMVELNGDDLKVTNPGRLAGGQTIMVWKRAK
jgi:Lipocalin-like domain